MNNNNDASEDELSNHQSTLLIRCKQTIEELHRELEQAECREKALNEQLNTVRERLRNKDLYIEDLKRNQIEKKFPIEKPSEDLSQVMVKYVQTLSENQNLNRQLEKITSQYNQNKQRLNRENEEYKKQLAFYERQRDKISNSSVPKQSLMELRNQIEKLTDENEKLSNLHWILLEDKKILNQIIQTKQSEINKLANKLHEYKRNMAELENIHQKQIKILKDRPKIVAQRDPEKKLNQRGSQKKIEKQSFNSPRQPLIRKNSKSIQDLQLSHNPVYEPSQQYFSNRPLKSVKSGSTLLSTTKDLYGIVSNRIR